MSTLADLKVGDHVILSYWGTWTHLRSIHPVASVTKTRIRITGVGAGVSEYRRDAGNKVGDSGYSGSRICPATPELLVEVRAERRRTKLIRTLRDTDWSKVTPATLEAVACYLSMDGKVETNA